ncbi:LytTR family DNA-binding domain-containing protein [Hoeflea poritis]|uniref:LytTR family DNA-binding domain-containing protein n=1 Tax=Hoeflea poritis TaxID=2993659 RepID=A0ABT4VM32_9HYPH|nr:LytTR family DNA-binding domain-containing protein [Hoeflea poritis]MDA4845220.1 LytTR family DNA-binding domain-containing protein [Hoeflea poritis]
MTDRSLQFTLREWWRFVSAPKTAVVVAAAGLVLGLSGPFGTYEVMHPLARLVYWELTAFLTFGVGWLNARLIAEHTPARKLGVLPAYAVAGLIGGIPIYAVVELINLAGNIGAPQDLQSRAILFVYCTAFNFCMCMLVAWLYSSAVKALPQETENAAPRLLRRLPIGLRGPLSHLSMQDHYVEVVTDRGSQLVLMRLADAISETRPVPGLQVHRSHWVALEAVARTRREKERYVVEMKGGAVLPISRSHVQAARAAGLLPAG